MQPARLPVRSDHAPFDVADPIAARVVGAGDGSADAGHVARMRHRHDALQGRLDLGAPAVDRAVLGREVHRVADVVVLEDAELRHVHGLPKPDFTRRALFVRALRRVQLMHDDELQAAPVDVDAARS